MADVLPKPDAFSKELERLQKELQAFHENEGLRLARAAVLEAWRDLQDWTRIHDGVRGHESSGAVSKSYVAARARFERALRLLMEADE